MGFLRSMAKRVITNALSQTPRSRGSSAYDPQARQRTSSPPTHPAPQSASSIHPPQTPQSASSIHPPQTPQRASGTRMPLASQPAPRCAPADLAALKAACQPRGRPLILHHWATWCDPCEEELPRVERLYRALDGKADLLGISWDLFAPSGTPEAVAAQVAAFAAAKGLSWPTLLFTGSPDALFEGLELEHHHIPQTRVLAADGRPLRTFQQPLEDEDVAVLLEMLGG